MQGQILRDEVLDVIRDAVRDGKSLVTQVGETKVVVTFTATPTVTVAQEPSPELRGSEDGNSCPYALIATIRAGVEDFQATLSR